MNWYKIRKIMNYVKKQGSLPVDPYGQFLSVDEMIDWFSLRNRLNSTELRQIEKELSLLIEAQILLVELETEGI